MSESNSIDPSTSPTQMAAKALRILLVDADPEYLAANRQRLELDGHEVHTATDGASALELAAGWAPDLLVLAMVLPRIDGLAVLEKLRTQERTQALPVIVLSSNTERRLVRRSRELRAVDYLSKQSKSTDPAMLSTAIFRLAPVSSRSTSRLVARAANIRAASRDRFRSLSLGLALEVFRWILDLMVARFGSP